MAFNPTLPVQTRDGRKARILCTDAKGKRPIIALVERSSGDEYISWHSAEGQWWETNEISADDLINIPEKRWIGVFRGDDGEVLPIDETFDSPEETKAWFAQEKLDLIACIEFAVGDGL